MHIYGEDGQSGNSNQNDVAVSKGGSTSPKAKLRIPAGAENLFAKTTPKKKKRKKKPQNGKTAAGESSIIKRQHQTDENESVKVGGERYVKRTDKFRRDGDQSSSSSRLSPSYRKSSKVKSDIYNKHHFKHHPYQIERSDNRNRHTSLKKEDLRDDTQIEMSNSQLLSKRQRISTSSSYEQHDIENTQPKKCGIPGLGYDAIESEESCGSGWGMKQLEDHKRGEKITSDERTLNDIPSTSSGDDKADQYDIIKERLEYFLKTLGSDVNLGLHKLLTVDTITKEMAQKAADVAHMLSCYFNSICQAFRNIESEI